MPSANRAARTSGPHRASILLSPLRRSSDARAELADARRGARRRRRRRAGERSSSSAKAASARRTSSRARRAGGAARIHRRRRARLSRSRRGVPYAVFSDALLPVLRAVEPSVLTLLTPRRNGGADAALSRARARWRARRRRARGDPAELKARLLWNFSQFLSRFAAKRPLLLVLENLQWADSASLEMLHFVARQIARRSDRARRHAQRSRPSRRARRCARPSSRCAV